MARDLTDHNAMSLDVMKHSTALMKELKVLTPDVVKEQIKEVTKSSWHSVPDE